MQVLKNFDQKKKGLFWQPLSDNPLTDMLTAGNW